MGAPENRLAFIDCESTGLNTRLHDVIEAAWAIGRLPVERIIFPHTLEHADPAALKINRYYERGLDAYEDDRMALTVAPQRRKFIADLTGATVVAEHYGFDVALLFRKLGFEPWHYRKIELSSVAMTVFNLDRPEGLNATAARLRRAGYDIYEGDHTAVADVECLRDCYWALRDLRNSGGDAMDKAASL